MIKWSGFAGAGVVLALFMACSEDEVQQISQRGEACERHADCASGLACQGGVCTIGSFNVPPTGNECVLIECERKADCCDEDPICASLEQQCRDGSTSACDSVALQCTCNAECVDNQCRSTCNDETPCPTGTYCEAGQCVQCQCDAHCGTGINDATYVCRSGMCVEECNRDADCEPFERCRENECVDVGCETDRECIAALSNVLAFCDSNKECQVRCSSDLECDNGEAFSFEACVEGTCRDVGCESAEECRAYFKRIGRGGDRPNAVCRPRVAPPEPGVPGVGGPECPEVPCADTCTYALNGTCNETTGLCAEGTDCTDCRCRNGRMDVGEVCDGSVFGGSTCVTVLNDPGATGTLSCSDDCQTIYTTNCFGTSTCGDGIVDPATEECDGTNLNGETCNSATFGLYPGGTLDCYSDCTFDTFYCTTTTGYCGDGIVDPSTEECDGTNLNGETCSTATSGLYPTGSLLCSGCYFDTFYCEAASYCGDGVIDAGESCDLTSFGGATCSTVTGGQLPLGTLYCDSSFCTVDTSGCYRGCSDTCPTYANNGSCDETSLCALGTDCTDCCTDSCVGYTLNGVCDELSGACTYGTDCTDCTGG